MASVFPTAKLLQLQAIEGAGIVKLYLCLNNKQMTADMSIALNFYLFLISCIIIILYDAFSIHRGDHLFIRCFSHSAVPEHVCYSLQKLSLCCLWLGLFTEAKH